MSQLLPSAFGVIEASSTRTFATGNSSSDTSRVTRGETQNGVPPENVVLDNFRDSPLQAPDATSCAAQVVIDSKAWREFHAALRRREDWTPATSITTRCQSQIAPDIFTTATCGTLDDKRQARYQRGVEAGKTLGHTKPLLLNEGCSRMRIDFGEEGATAPLREDHFNRATILIPQSWRVSLQGRPLPRLQ